MSALLKKFSQLLILLTIILLLSATGRVIFYFSNSLSFDAFSGSEIFHAIFKGLEYDFLTVIFINILFIFFFLWPAKIYNSGFYISFLKILFITINGAALLLNLFDIRIFQLHGHRLRAFEFLEEVKLFFNELQTGKLNELISRYLSLAIYFLIFLIIIWLSLKLIKRRNFQQEKKIIFHKWISVFVLIGIITGYVFNNLDRTNWLTKLYLKSDRRLIPLVVNNPYLLFCSFRSEEIEKLSDWSVDKFNSTSKYESLKFSDYEDIRLMIVEKVELTELTDVGGYVSLSSLNHYTGNIFQFLDEVLLSFPGIYTNGFYQSVYSLNKFDNLLDILQREGYSTSLSVIGYDDKIERLIRNFYGFSKSSKKRQNFEVILINGRDNESNLLQANVDFVESKSLIIRMEIALTGEDESKLVRSISFITSDGLPFFKDISSIITQPLDLKPSILHLAGYNDPFTTFGSSLFASEEKVIFQSISDISQIIIKDSLLLKHFNNETIELKRLEKKGLSYSDFKDSLAVERIILENKIQAILRDYKLRLKNNSL